jgi:hypothetical protein
MFSTVTDGTCAYAASEMIIAARLKRIVLINIRLFTYKIPLPRRANNGAKVVIINFL